MVNAIPVEVQEPLGSKLGRVKSFSFSSGGCINNGGKLSTTTGDYFIKWNDRKKYPGMFEAEAKGLLLLENPQVIHIPSVIFAGHSPNHQFIVLEFIEQRSKQDTFWDDLAVGLANLHRQTSPHYGLDHDNYIGSLPQTNKVSENWIDFFIQQRLNPQLERAVNSRRIDKAIRVQFEALYKKLHSLLPVEKPALLHGDLWSGNLITDSSGSPCLIDPAVYYGSREIEIAFTTLFGGFSNRFYEAYDDVLPLMQGYENRIDLYNLYPLLVHVNLFGGGYVSQVVSILRTFV